MRLLGLLPAFSACVLVLLSLHGASASISLGSVSGTRYMEALPGETSNFELLLFNIHDNSSVQVDVVVEGPEGWAVSSSPSTFNLDFSAPGNCFSKQDYVCLNTGLGGVMARPVKVTTDIPDSATPGEYVISASVYVGGGDIGVTMVQSRTYHFTVKVKEAEPDSSGDDNAEATDSPGSTSAGAGGDDESGSTGAQEPESGKTVPGDDENDANMEEAEPIQESDGLTGMMISEGITAGLFAFIIIIIIAASWRLYKRD